MASQALGRAQEDLRFYLNNSAIGLLAMIPGNLAQEAVMLAQKYWFCKPPLSLCLEMIRENDPEKATIVIGILLGRLFERSGWSLNWATLLSAASAIRQREPDFSPLERVLKTASRPLLSEA